MSSPTKKWNSKTMKEYVESINNEGYKIFPNESDTAKDKVCFRCPAGHEYMAKFVYFKIGNRCPKCVHDKVHGKQKQIMEFIFNRPTKPNKELKKKIYEQSETFS